MSRCRDGQTSPRNGGVPCPVGDIRQAGRNPGGLSFFERAQRRPTNMVSPCQSHDRTSLNGPLCMHPGRQATVFKRETDFVRDGITIRLPDVAIQSSSPDPIGDRDEDPAHRFPARTARDWLAQAGRSFAPGRSNDVPPEGPDSRLFPTASIRCILEPARGP